MLPKWLKLENKLVPTVYEQVWQAVRVTPANQYCDTTIITQLFTTSGLSLEKLGYLWSLTNVSSPGFLTQQELYVMLALIALVQVIFFLYTTLVFIRTHEYPTKTLRVSFIDWLSDKGHIDTERHKSSYSTAVELQLSQYNRRESGHQPIHRQ